MYLFSVLQPVGAFTFISPRLTAHFFQPPYKQELFVKLAASRVLSRGLHYVRLHESLRDDFDFMLMLVTIFKFSVPADMQSGLRIFTSIAFNKFQEPQGLDFTYPAGESENCEDILPCSRKFITSNLPSKTESSF